MSAPVFLGDEHRVRAANVGDTVLLDGAEGRHAGVVQRKAVGERVDVVDGAGVRLVGRIASVVPDGVLVEVVERVDEPAPAVPLVLVQALAKGDRDELAIEAATEVGADGVVPWQADRSIVVWRGDRAAKSRARWLGTVRTAAKQSRRAWVPEVGVAVDSKALAVRVAAAVAAGGGALVLHEEASVPIAEAALPVSGELLVVVGPEGGIGDDELRRLTDAGARAVRLGPHVLRTSTAGPVALALLAQRSGRWG
ncbi:16S rRNA (uracil(1498)-N(3))-methyltransferase [Cellulomonas sp. PhB150]|uniref:16S rRNA (uracil(1498)-N(3))-methyltransferase n=1 Tax=Cellulomonas sp. PhB150 TaxID=2485188 RepID=UPI000F498B15|nr:16S rRNA (uracil(1498)-N(3))-methyltransferase [Cellulomonas sp. PhB150]ROS31041.1 16S rRNA (uracil1498-N3)-methyltransferase [Cellulomonas sp. PhB150]